METLPKQDKFSSNLDAFAVMLSEKARSYPVVIGQIYEIEGATQRKRSMEKDLKLMKPQIEAILTRCGALSTESASDQYSKLLNNNVNRLYQCWQSAIETVAARRHVLEQMLADCRQYSVSFAETDRWILHHIRSYGTDDIGVDVATIKQQLDILESERLEIMGCRQRVDMVIEMAETLINKYNSDDPSQLVSDVKRISEHWQELMSRLAEREKSLQNAVNAMYRFDSDMKNSLLWLTKVEVVLDHYNAMTTDLKGLDEEQYYQIQDAIQGLQIEIDAHWSVLQSLNCTAQQMTRKSAAAAADSTANSSTNLQSQLDDMNCRWARLSSRATNISNRLEMATKSDPCEEQVTKLGQLLQWLADKSEELQQQQPVGGDIQSVTQQIDFVKNVEAEISGKQAEVNECLQNAEKTIAEQSTVEEILTSESLPGLKHAVEDVNVKWSDIQQKSSSFKSVLEGTLENGLDDLHQRLVALERETMKWLPVDNIPSDDLQNQIDVSLAFQQKVVPLQSELDRCNVLANQFTDVVLCHKTVGQLEDVKKRWTGLDQSVGLRLRQLREALNECGSQSQQLLAGSVSTPWQRAVSDNSVPYYIDHSNKSTKWDHPEMARITQSLGDFNTVRFSAYRTAMKLHKLQTQLNLDLVDLEGVTKVLTSLPTAKGAVDTTVLTVPDIVDKLMALYKPMTIRAPMSREVNIPLHVDLVLNWLLNVYDSGRSGQIRLNSFKVALVLMCNGHYEDKYRAIFSLSANDDGRIDRLGMTALLRDCIQIPKQLGEVAAFGGSNVEPSVQSCFEKTGSQPYLTVNQFVDWMKLEPQSMVWIPVMHRVAAAESSQHHVRCSACKGMPVVGLRYRCLKCFSFEMCQTCFFTGRTAKSHKLSHPMQEYCGTTSSSEDMRDLTKVFKNMLRSKQYFKRHPRLGYLPVHTVMEDEKLERSASEASTLADVKEHAAFSNGTCMTSTPEERTSAVDADRPERLKEAEQTAQQISMKADVEDEHKVIAKYCKHLQEHSEDYLKSPMQIVAGLEADQQAEMEGIIRKLEADNRSLQMEYDQLLIAHPDNASARSDLTQQDQSNGVGPQSTVGVGVDAELLAEAKQLAKHKSQLEVRMRILEDHNRQLEAQLQRLRQLLDQSAADSDATHVVTFSSSDRRSSTTAVSPSSSAYNSLPRRDPPSFASYQQSVRAPNGTYSSSEQRLLSEEEELERMMKELQETFSPSLGTDNVGNLFQSVGQVSKAVGTLVTIMTVDESSSCVGNNNNNLMASGIQ